MVGRLVHDSDLTHEFFLTHEQSFCVYYISYTNYTSSNNHFTTTTTMHIQNVIEQIIVICLYVSEALASDLETQYANLCLISAFYGMKKEHNVAILVYFSSGTLIKL